MNPTAPVTNVVTEVLPFMVDSVKCGTIGDHPHCPHTTRTPAVRQRCGTVVTEVPTHLTALVPSNVACRATSSIVKQGTTSSPRLPAMQFEVRCRGDYSFQTTTHLVATQRNIPDRPTQLGISNEVCRLGADVDTAKDRRRARSR
jgi:hypothetical protein